MTMEIFPGPNLLSLANITNLLTTGSIATLSIGFSAHKNGSDQTGIVINTPTKITYTTELFDVGSYYDAANSKWAPPAGLVSLSFATILSSVTASALCRIYVYKDGSAFKDVLHTADAGGNCGLAGGIIDRANGTAYYEVYVSFNGASNGTAAGAATDSFFMGKML